MSRKHPSLSRLLQTYRKPKSENGDELESLQLKMLRIQQGIFHQKRRAIIVIEGFDAAGKGGAIRRLTEKLDPRGFQVHNIGPPDPVDQGKHYLYRFWARLPAPGSIAVFDRSWYGRVLVERVNKLIPKERWKAAYEEINQFERLLLDDGLELLKIFLGVTQEEQLRRFQERLEDPYKRWKLTEADVLARARWDEYVVAADELLERTDTQRAPWRLIPGDDKHSARVQTLSEITGRLSHHGRWMESQAKDQKRVRSLESAIRELGMKKSALR